MSEDSHRTELIKHVACGLGSGRDGAAESRDGGAPEYAMNLGAIRPGDVALVVHSETHPPQKGGGDP
jgi:hypothetical protein